MDKALAREKQSPHPTHKVGALICGLDIDGQYFERIEHNFWPEVLKQSIGTDKKLGNSSTTIHAELAALFKAPISNNADIYITDLPCPNCTKTIIQAGIKNVYIDSHTHNTPLGLKMKPYFDNVSMLLFEKAGLGIYEMNAPQKNIITLLEHAPINYYDTKYQIRSFPFDKNNSEKVFIREVKDITYTPAFAACLAKDRENNTVFVTAKTSMSYGLSKNDAQNIRSSQNKYAATLQPINHLVAICAKHGLNIDKEFIFSSQTPTSREFVNLIGAGFKRMYIGNKSQCRDKWGVKALEQLENKKIIDII